MKILTPTIKAPANLVFDVDDVLWPLNETACRRAGIEYERTVCFKVMENPLLTEDEKRRMFDAYTDPTLHDSMPMYPGTRAFGKIAADPRVSAWICSNSVVQESIDNKERNLKAFFGPDWTNFRTMFNLIDMSGAHTKKFPPDIWCLFDDSPHNAVASGARHVMMPKRPWNTSGLGMEPMLPILDRVIYYSCNAEAVELLTRLMDRDLGPRME